MQGTPKLNLDLYLAHTHTRAYLTAVHAYIYMYIQGF